MKGQMLRRMIAMGLTLCIVIGILPDGYAMDDTKGSVALYSDETITYVPFRMIDSSVDFEEFCDFLQREMGMNVSIVSSGKIVITPVGSGGTPMELTSGGTVTLPEGKYKVVISLLGTVREEGYIETILKEAGTLTLSFAHAQTDICLLSGEKTITLNAGDNTIVSGNEYTLRLSRKAGYLHGASYEGENIALTLDQDDPNFYIGTFTPDKEGSLVISVAEPVREGYTLTGWLGTDGKVYPSPLTSMPPCEITPQWQAIQYTITFVSMGGTTVKPITQAYNTTVNAPEEPKKEGYIFAGWYTREDGTGTRYFAPDEETVQMVKDLTLYASWSVQTYPVVLNTDGGILNQSHPNVASGGAVDLTAYVPQKAGYAFAGWFTEDDRQIVTYTMKAEPLEVTARYLSYLDMLLTMNPDEFSRNDVLLKNAREYYGKLNASQLGEYTGTNHQKMLYAAIKEASIKKLKAAVEEAETPANDLLQDIAGLSPTDHGYDVILADSASLLAGLMETDFLEKLLNHNEVAGYTVGETDFEVRDLTRMVAYAAMGSDHEDLDAFKAWLDAEKDTLTVKELDGKEVSLQIHAKTTEGISYDLEYTLSFFCNTHTISWLDEDGETLLAETTVNYDELVKEPTVEKTGHTLVGWQDQTGNLVDLSVEKMGKSDRSYTAVWKPVRILVTFHYGYDNKKDTASYTYGEAFGTLPEPETRQDYAFLGWYTEPSGGQQITAQTKVLNIEDTTVYAQWDEIIPPEDADYFALQEAIASIPSNMTGYTTDSVQALKDVLSEVEYGLTEEHQNKVDAWTAAILDAIRELMPKAFTVTFDPGEGTADYTEKTVVYRKPFGVLPAATRTGYDFLGWFTAETGGSRVICDTVMEETDNVTLYAHYEEQPGDYTLVDRYLMEIGEAGDLGVYDNESLAKIQAAIDGVVRGLGAGRQTEIDEMARSLQSAWNNRQCRRVTVTLDANGGTCETASMKYRYGEPYSGLPTATRKGYHFLDWFTAKNSGNKVDGSMLMKDVADHTLYAHWEWYSADYSGVDRALAKIPSDLTPYTEESRNALAQAINGVKYGLGGEYQSKVDIWAADISRAISALQKKTLVVSFDAAGGKVSPQSQSVAYGACPNLPIPTKNGYEFTGWYTSDGTKYSETTAITAFVTLYARWTPLPADYTEVNKALSAIPEDLGIYTKASADAVKAARDAVKQGLSSEEQSKVDGWAAAIRSAIDGLVRVLPFVDVKEKDWFYPYVSDLYYAGIINGTGDGTTYSPNMVTDRAQMAVLLYRISGSPESSGKHPFVDVPEKAYYYDAVCWAYANGVVNGTGDGSTFSPYMGITREMFATMLYRLYGEPKLGGNLSNFPDGKSVSSWALDGMTFAVETGIITGKGDGTLAPQAKATRAEVATMLRRYMDLIG